MEPDLELTDSMIGRAIVTARANAVVVSDRDGVIILWNPGAERIFGHSAREALGQTLDLIIPDRLRAEHWEGFRRVMASGHSQYSDSDLLCVPALRKDGSQLSVEFTITPIQSDAGGIIGLVAVLRDVTARFQESKELRRQLEAFRRPGAAH